MKKLLTLFLYVSSSLLFSQTVSAQVQKSSTTQNNNINRLSISANQFKSNFNTLASEIGAPQIQKIELEDELEGKSFSVQMQSHLAIIGNTDTNGGLKSLSVGLDTNGIDKSEIFDQFQMLGGFAMTAIKAVDGNKNDDNRDKAVQNLLIDLMSDKKTPVSPNKKTKFYKSYKLVAYSDPRASVVMIGISPKNN